MPDLFNGTLPIDLDAQLREVEREMAQRRRVYPRFVADGRMTQAAADRQVAVMEAVAGTLRGNSGGAAERAVAEAGFWFLTHSLQSHMFRAPTRVFDMAAFAPEARLMCSAAEQRLYDACAAVAGVSDA